MAGGLVRREIRAMDSDIELISAVPGGERRFGRAEMWLAGFEGRFSRFRLLSELSLLNRSAGTPVRVSPPLLRLVEMALALARRSGGIFDPTILPDLETAGYDRSFELIDKRAPRRARPARHPHWQDVVIDHAGGAITLPPGSRLDLGGIGKGWAVDRLAFILGSPCLVNGGGDVHAAGRPPGEASWRIGVANPFDASRDIATLHVRDRGVATSSTMNRRWRADDAVMHHLIDPRTGLPSVSDAVQVTAVAGSTMLADFYAKTALLRGVKAGLAYLEEEPDAEALIVSRGGGQWQTSGLVRYLTAPTE